MSYTYCFCRSFAKRGGLKRRPLHGTGKYNFHRIHVQGNVDNQAQPQPLCSEECATHRSAPQGKEAQSFIAHQRTVGLGDRKGTLRRGWPGHRRRGRRAQRARWRRLNHGEEGKESEAMVEARFESKMQRARSRGLPFQEHEIVPRQRKPEQSTGKA